MLTTYIIYKTRIELVTDILIFILFNKETKGGQVRRIMVINSPNAYAT
jgi:hypothetical protein